MASKELHVYKKKKQINKLTSKEKVLFNKATQDIENELEVYTNDVENNNDIVDDWMEDIAKNVRRQTFKVNIYQLALEHVRNSKNGGRIDKLKNLFEAKLKQFDADRRKTKREDFSDEEFDNDITAKTKKDRLKKAKHEEEEKPPAEHVKPPAENTKPTRPTLTIRPDLVMEPQEAEPMEQQQPPMEQQQQPTQDQPEPQTVEKKEKRNKGSKVKTRAIGLKDPTFSKPKHSKVLKPKKDKLVSPEEVYSETNTAIPPTEVTQPTEDHNFDGITPEGEPEQPQLLELNQGNVEPLNPEGQPEGQPENSADPSEESIPPTEQDVAQDPNAEVAPEEAPLTEESPEEEDFTDSPEEIELFNNVAEDVHEAVEDVIMDDNENIIESMIPNDYNIDTEIIENLMSDIVEEVEDVNTMSPIPSYLEAIDNFEIDDVKKYGLIKSQREKLKKSKNAKVERMQDDPRILKEDKQKAKAEMKRLIAEQKQYKEFLKKTELNSKEMEDNIALDDEKKYQSHQRYLQRQQQIKEIQDKFGVGMDLGDDSKKNHESKMITIKRSFKDFLKDAKLRNVPKPDIDQDKKQSTEHFEDRQNEIPEATQKNQEERALAIMSFATNANQNNAEMIKERINLANADVSLLFPPIRGPDTFNLIKYKRDGNGELLLTTQGYPIIEEITEITRGIADRLKQQNAIVDATDIACTYFPLHGKNCKKYLSKAEYSYLGAKTIRGGKILPGISVGNTKTISSGIDKLLQEIGKAVEINHRITNPNDPVSVQYKELMELETLKSAFTQYTNTTEYNYIHNGGGNNKEDDQNEANTLQTAKEMLQTLTMKQLLQFLSNQPQPTPQSLEADAKSRVLKEKGSLNPEPGVYTNYDPEPQPKPIEKPKSIFGFNPTKRGEGRFNPLELDINREQETVKNNDIFMTNPFN
jgi:hypothetical protein